MRYESTTMLLVVISLFLMACNNQSNYEKYSSCLLKTMNGQDKSMMYYAMENCELKYPYEKKINWKNKVDFGFSFDPVQNKVPFFIEKNISDYRITKIQVSGNYLACEDIHEDKTAQSNWSSPVEIKFNKGKGEIDLAQNPLGLAILLFFLITPFLDLDRNILA